MGRNSLFVDVGGPMGSSRSGCSHPNDDDCSVDKYLVKTLERKRNSVMQLMNKAEEKQFSEPDIKEWLVDIKHTMYDANALLDKIDTEARFRKKYKENGSPSYSISEFVRGATLKVNRIIEELENMLKEAGDMGLKARDEGAAASAQQTRIPNDRVTSPVLGKSTIVYGREEKKEQILKKVLYSPEPAAPGIKPEVIAIVGEGGLGKTTLAQYVYNHADVERCFTRSWACVSDKFDLVRVTRDILESLTGTAAGVYNLAPLQQQLVKQLTGERFLVVLDDAWDFCKQNWDKLMAPFSTGAAGSKIILTTRDTRVAGVAPANHSFQLKPMFEDEAWSLFSCEVFGDGELSQHPKLEAIGKEIVKKCGGSPLAIKTLSGLLRSERKEVEWERVRESSLWQLPEGQKDIIPALGLSYSYLPSHLKTCFGYCSLFPKDYRFSKKELVNLWVDEGFLQQPHDNRSIEDVGVASFEDLSSRSFFTPYYEDEEYVMHDLIHDFAQMVFADFHLQLNGHKAVKECKKVRHVSFHDPSEWSSSSILEDQIKEFQAESLQTFMVASRNVLTWNLDGRPNVPRWDGSILKDVLLQQHSLRVLCLRGTGIPNLPDTVCNLKQLRCLDVSYTDVHELPPSLCMLYNLRSLLCESCDQIKEFHYDMADFVSLRRFTLSGRQLRQVTLSRGQLQERPWNLSQLIQVKLAFQLPYGGDDRMNQGDGTDSSNHSESGLHIIVDMDISTFGIRFDFDGKNTLIDRYPLVSNPDSIFLLKSLRPRRDVKEVRIEKFNGTEFPGWLVDRFYHNIERVKLVDCRISSGLMPALGGLPSLKCLQLTGVRNVRKLGLELYNSTEDPFGSLEELHFYSMYDWEEWEPSDGAAAGGGKCFFRRLQVLSIVGCPKLKGRLPSNLPSLKMLRIDGCSSLVELNGCHRHRQVVDLEIKYCGPRLANSCLVDLRPEMFPHLQSLVIGDCDSFESFPAKDSLPTSLTYLQIQNFTRLKKLDVFWLRSLTNLKELWIKYCDLLESLGYSSDVDDCSSDDEFPFKSSLRVLHVSMCKKLKTINGAWLRSLTNLKELRIKYCDLLESLGYSSDVDDCSSDDEFPFKSSLRVLHVSMCKKLKTINGAWLRNLISLQELTISGCVNLEALPEDGLPRSLTRLDLERFKNIDWIAIQNLTSLEELTIRNCQLKAIPVKLPCSLKKLKLWRNHRDLTGRWKRDSGPDWPNIAHVPDIWIS